MADITTVGNQIAFSCVVCLWQLNTCWKVLANGPCVQFFECYASGGAQAHLRAFAHYAYALSGLKGASLYSRLHTRGKESKEKRWGKESLTGTAMKTCARQVEAVSRILVRTSHLHTGPVSVRVVFVFNVTGHGYVTVEMVHSSHCTKLSFPLCCVHLSLLASASVHNKKSLKDVPFVALSD